MSLGKPLPARITEPFLAAWVALWLVGRGARDLVVSVDGAQPDRMRIVEILKDNCYQHDPPVKGPAWTGQYTAPDRPGIRVTTMPGPDIVATMHGGRRMIGECKGQPTATAERSGQDLVSSYAALGQILFAAADAPSLPDTLLLAFPKTVRFSGFARRLADNRLLNSLPIDLEVVLVDGVGVAELIEPSH
jgi:hypothetical protein